MITVLADKVAYFFVRKGVAKEEDIEIYQYGVGLFLSTVFDIIAVIIISLFTGMVLGTVFFMIFFMSLRTLTGGYHADSYFKCFLVFIVVYSLSSLTVFLTPDAYIMQFIFWLTVVSSIFIVAFSPVESNNKPLSIEQKIILRKKSLIIYLTQVIIVFVGMYFLKDFSKDFYFASLGYVTASLALVVAIKKENERRRKNEKENV